MKSRLVQVISLLALAMAAGCATQSTPFEVRLAPVPAARMFSEDTPAARMLGPDQRQWLVGAAYYLSRTGTAFADNDQLFDFLEQNLGHKIALRDRGAVAELAPMTFAMTSSAGNRITIHVSGSRITLTCAAPEDTQALVQSMFAVSDGSSSVPRNSVPEPPNFSWAHALAHALGGSH